MNVFRKAALCASLASVAAAAPDALATTVTVDVFANGSYSLTPSSDLSWVLANYAPQAKGNGAFASFCIEENEVLYQHGVYNAVLNSFADSGGSGRNDLSFMEGDVISQGTAFLYERFALGTLAEVVPGFNYGKNSITALQETIWWLEHEMEHGKNHYAALLDAQFGSSENARENYTGSAVKVLNLTEVVNGQTVKRQDQLIYTAPDGGATVALLGLSLGGIALLRRKFATA